MFAAADAPPPSQSSLIEDCIDIWFAPSAVFARRVNAGAWGPYLVTTLLLATLYFAGTGAMQGIFDAEMAKAVAQARADNPALTDDQVAQMQRVMEGGMKYGGLVAMPFVLLTLGVGVWLTARVLGGALSFGGGVMVASLAYLPRTVDMLLFIVQSFVLDTGTASHKFQYSIGVGRFLDPAMNQGLYNLLGRVDVFSIWVSVLLALGLIHTAKVTREKAIGGAVALWVLGGLPAVIQAFSGS